MILIIVCLIVIFIENQFSPRIFIQKSTITLNYTWNNKRECFIIF